MNVLVGQPRASELVEGIADKRLYETLSAFANRTGGGVLPFGLDEEGSFEVAAQALVVTHHSPQEQCGHLFAQVDLPAQRPAKRLVFNTGKHALPIQNKTHPARFRCPSAPPPGRKII